jgi:hypothetical protein
MQARPPVRGVPTGASCQYHLDGKVVGRETEREPSICGMLFTLKPGERSSTLSPFEHRFLGRAILQASGMSCRSLQSLKLACGRWGLAILGLTGFRADSPDFCGFCGLL